MFFVQAKSICSMSYGVYFAQSPELMDALSKIPNKRAIMSWVSKIEDTRSILRDVWPGKQLVVIILSIII